MTLHTHHREEGGLMGDLSPAQKQRNDQRRRAELARQKKQFDEDKRALRRLIRFYTRRRDWFMVERLMNDLGRFFEKEATS